MTSLPAGLRPGTAALLLPVLTALLLGWHTLADRDVWFHARAGADLLAEGRLVQANRYSFTAPDHPWLNHEWLFQAAVAATGPAAIPPAPGAALWGWHLLRSGLVLALVLVLLLGDGLAGRDAAEGRRALAALAALAGLALLWTRLTLRPELVSYLLLAVVVRAVQGTLAAAAPPTWRAWCDPRQPAGRATLATLLWAQVHGFASLVPAVWLLGLAGALVDGRGRGAGRLLRRSGAGILLALAALAATPNGPAGLVLPLRAAAQFGGDRPDLQGVIAELVPLLQTRDALGTTLLVYRLSLVWALVWIVSQWGRVPAARVLLVIAGAAAAAAAQRALGAYAVAFVLLHTGTRWPLRLPARLRAHPRAGAAGAAAAAVALAAACAAWWPALVSDRFYLGEGVVRRFGPGLTPAHAPLGTLETLRASGARTVAANVDAAGAVLAAGGPAVFIDGRTEAYPPELWRDYGALRRGGEPARAVLARWRPEAVLLAYGSGAFAPLAADLVADPAWHVQDADGAAVLFLPGAGGDAAGPLRAAAARLLSRAGQPGLASARAADLCLAAARTSELAGDAAAAAAALARGASLRPDHPQVQHNLGNALLARQDHAAALAAFAAAVAANGRQAGSALNAGVCALRLGREDEARDWFARAARIDPARFEAWVNLAVVLQRQGDREGARRALEKAVALRPGDANLRERLRRL